MTCVLQTARINIVDSAMFVNRIREIVYFELGKELENDIFRLVTNLLHCLLNRSMADKVCSKLIKGRPWVKYTNANKIPHERGIYAIGYKNRGKKKVKYLYLGQSKDVHARLKQHKYGIQHIDQFVKRNFRRNGTNLRVKWIKEPKHKKKESSYIKCVERMLSCNLTYNKRGRGKWNMVKTCFIGSSGNVSSFVGLEVIQLLGVRTLILESRNDCHVYAQDMQV